MEEAQRLLERILDGDEDPTDLPLALLQYITNDFSEENKIGHGGFAAVYKGVFGERIVAVKRIQINENTFDDKLFHREFVSLHNSNHRNVVRFLGFCSSTYQKQIEDARSGEIRLASVLERLLCFEYISGGSLDKHITDELRGLEWETRYKIITGICKGLRYLHNEKNIIHMDLKPANILLHHQEEYMVPKITDFGLSRPSKNSHTVGQRYGTRGYWAPEYREDSKTTTACDIYSLGAIIMELVTGDMEAPNKDNVLRRWRHRWNKPPTQLQYQQVTRCIDIAGRCREQKPEARPSVSNIISFLSESENTYGQISPLFNDDDMLRIKPLELRLNFELKNETSHSIELTNGTCNYIAFNIQLPSKKYTAQQAKGIVQPESKCGVKITVQPRDSNDVEKCIVKSMKVSQVLIDKDITESMFEEAGKVVDEVNLMVVHDPTVSLENCKRREDTRIPAEEVPEVISYMGRAGFTRSNLRPTQYIKAYQCALMNQPTNQQGVTMNLVTGAMGSLLPKMSELLKEEYKLNKAVKEAIKSLEKDMKSMYAVLRKVAEVPRDQLDEHVRLWAGEVRELSFDMEDVIDKFLIPVEDDDSEPATKWNILKQLIEKMLGLFTKGMARRQIAYAIEDINRQVQEVADRHGRYTVDNIVARPPAAVIDPRLGALYKEPAELVGIAGKRDQELMNLLSEGDSVSTKKLRIISVVGFGGLGKTTLVKMVYDKIKGDFDCKAFVPIGRNADAKKILIDILLDLHMYESHLTMLDERQLINKLRERLESKRYLIVIDDIWDKELWKVVNLAFASSNNFGSRLITTTRIFSVSELCCSSSNDSVYQLEPLSDDDSRRLFYKRIFHESGCPQEFEQVSIGILKKCGGVPLAIITIASLLASNQQVKPKDEWHILLDSIGHGLTEDPSVEEMMRILSFSYYDLPAHLKTCLLYLSMFPEDYLIGKDRLIWLWIAESFLQCGKAEASLFEIGETYFVELVNRNMIQRVYNHEDRAEDCRVHDMVLDLITSLSSENNFVTILNGTGDSMSSKSNVRRISLQNARQEEGCEATPLKSVCTLQLRSLATFEPAIGVMPPFLSLIRLRVLDLNRCHIGEHNHLNLRDLGSLLHLRYLCLAQTRISGVPEEVGKLQFLQVLDLRGNYFEELPSAVIKLRRLICLLIDRQCRRFPDGLGNLTSVEVVSKIHGDSLSTLKELGNLKRLRKLGIEFRILSSELEEAFVESLRTLSKIQSLEIVVTGAYTESTEIFGERWLPPRSLQEFLTNGYIEFSTLPAWIRRNPSHLSNLFKLEIRVDQMGQESVEILGRLPALRSLILWILRHRGPLLVGANGFPFLTSFDWISQSPCDIMFEAGGMPKVEKVHLQIGLPVENEEAAGNGGDLGLGNLPSLWNVTVRLFQKRLAFGQAKQAKAALVKALRAHPNSPTFSISISILPDIAEDAGDEDVYFTADESETQSEEPAGARDDDVYFIDDESETQTEESADKKRSNAQVKKRAIIPFKLKRPILVQYWATRRRRQKYEAEKEWLSLLFVSGADNY